MIPLLRRRDTHGRAQRDGFDGKQRWSAPDKGSQKAKQSPLQKILKSCSHHSRGRPRVVHTKNQSTLVAARFLLARSLVHSSMVFVLLSGLFSVLLVASPPLILTLRIRSCGLVISDMTWSIPADCYCSLHLAYVCCPHSLSVPRAPFDSGGTEQKKL
jgi:hypothetical protein